jgi:hypothetical protein
MILPKSLSRRVPTRAVWMRGHLLWQGKSPVLSEILGNLPNFIFREICANRCKQLILGVLE